MPDEGNAERGEAATGKKWGHNPDTWMVILTALLMFIGIGTAWIFYGQFEEMSRQTKILNEQAKQAIKDSAEAGQKVEQQLAIARDQTNAAQDSVRAVQRQMRQDQRPWLDIQFDDIAWAEKQPLTVRMTLTNRGKTPAKNLNGGAFVEKILMHERPHLGNLVSRFGTGMLVPNLTVSAWGFYSARSAGVPVTMSVDDIKELQEGRAIAVVHGIVRFDDIFGIHHWVRFCSYTANKALLANLDIQDTAAPCVRYKNTDNN